MSECPEQPVDMPDWFSYTVESSSGLVYEYIDGDPLWLLTTEEDLILL